jgi:hypothetical protein
MAVDSPLLGWGTPTEDDALLPLNYTSPALASSCVVKTGPGLLVGFTVTNTSASSQYVLVFDATTLPADGTIPILAASVSANTTSTFNWIPGRTHQHGIILCNSSTNTSKTIGSANCIFDVQFL